MSEIRQINLADHIGHNIRNYCDYESPMGDDDLHCAHWVSHLLEYPRSKCGHRSVGKYCIEAPDLIEYDPDQPSNFFGRPRLIYVAKRARSTRRAFRLLAHAMHQSSHLP